MSALLSLFREVNRAPRAAELGGACAFQTHAFFPPSCVVRSSSPATPSAASRAALAFCRRLASLGWLGRLASFAGVGNR